MATKKDQPLPTTSITFEDILNEGLKKGLIPGKTQKARDWFRHRTLQEFKSAYTFRYYEKDRRVSGVSPGKMYFYIYDPKHKQTLEYYDTFPCVFPIEFYDNGFLGINFHYLPLNMRARLMDALYATVNNKRYDESTVLKINYRILKAAGRFKYFKPTVHRYLYSQMKSKFYEINSQEWDMALFMPWANFKKASVSKVWSDSMQKVKG